MYLRHNVAPVARAAVFLSIEERLAIHATLIAILFLPHFGAAIGTFSIALSLPFFILQTLTLWFRGTLRVDALSLLLFAAVLVAASFSLILNAGPSIASLALLTILYAPMILVGARADGGALADYSIGVLVRYVSIVAAVGCIQFTLQFLPGVTPWLDIRRFIPTAIAQEGHYNTFAFTGGLMRSNGFFLLEPSSLSLYSGIGLVAEWTTRRRPWLLLLMACGLVVALSGTGFLVVALPLLIRKPLYALLLVAGTAVAVIGLRITGFVFLVDRLNEFNSPGSSGYARFVAPFLVVSEGMDTNPWSAMLGNGPGAVLRAISSRISAFEIFDPTWAKLLYEYGVLGTFCLAIFIIAGMRRSHAQPEFRIAIIYAWLAAGGLLLQPNFVPLMPMLISWWRNDRKAVTPPGLDRN